MIGLDSNILIRLATRDSPSEYAACRQFFEFELGPERPGFVTVIALVEVCWTLRRTYRFSAERVHNYLEDMLESSLLVVERQPIVAAALEASRRGRMDIADALIAAIHVAEGCSSTVTLDKGFAATGEARLLGMAH